ncbi:MAG TPA: DoxX family protein [Calidithermus sp.]|nr:DoxX family protein [Calidithermus sp.]
MRGIRGIDPGWGLTAIRVVMALIFIHAGYMKVLGGGMEGAVQFFTKVGIPAPGIMAPFVGGLELFGGVLLLVGILARWLGLLFAIEFVVATFYVKLPATGWAQSRLDLMLLAGALALFLAGPGRAAVDRMWLEKERPARGMARAA